MGLVQSRNAIGRATYASLAFGVAPKK